ncbi:hypothetical protein FQA39_LY19287 [Lamprigera yunnana]|nr:hypothetical protein FQA39_LY19287 [Lamprigera yunnana]
MFKEPEQRQKGYQYRKNREAYLLSLSNCNMECADSVYNVTEWCKHFNQKYLKLPNENWKNSNVEKRTTTELLYYPHQEPFEQKRQKINHRELFMNLFLGTWVPTANNHFRHALKLKKSIHYVWWMEEKKWLQCSSIAHCFREDYERDYESIAVGLFDSDESQFVEMVK